MKYEKDETVKTIQDITGYESGIVVYSDNDVVLVNWTQCNGYPREFTPGVFVGTGDILDGLKAMEKDPSQYPENLIEIIEEISEKNHELQEQGKSLIDGEKTGIDTIYYDEDNNIYVITFID